MEGFSLPGTESTSTFQNTDIVRVEENGHLSSETVMVADEINDTIGNSGMNLLSNCEFEKASKSADGMECAAVGLDMDKKVCCEENGALSTLEIDERIQNSNALSKAERSSQPQENGEASVDIQPSTGGTEKLPWSRGSYPKTVKRRLRREKIKALIAEKKALRERTRDGSFNQHSSEKDKQSGSAQGKKIKSKLSRETNEGLLERIPNGNFNQQSPKKDNTGQSSQGKKIKRKLLKETHGAENEEAQQLEMITPGKFNQESSGKKSSSKKSALRRRRKMQLLRELREAVKEERNRILCVYSSQPSAEKDDESAFQIVTEKENEFWNSLMLITFKRSVDE